MKENETVLHIFGTLAHGGAELRTLDVSEHLILRGHQIHYCCLSGKPGVLAPKFEAQGSKVYPLRLDWRFPIRFYRLIKNEKYTVIHSHIHHSSGLILMIAAAAGVNKRICHYRSTGRPNDSMKLKGRVIEKIKKLLVQIFSTRIVAVSKGTMSQAWKSQWENDSRCSILYNGLNYLDINQPWRRDYINQSCIHPDLATENFIIHVGNMSDPKNHLRLIEIFSEINKVSEKDWTLLLIGRRQEPIASMVEARVKQLGLDNRVIILGERDDVLQIMYSASGMIFPSKWEGLPGAVLEAGLMDLPTLATNLPVIKEIEVNFDCINTASLDYSNEEWATAFLKKLHNHKRLSIPQLNQRFEKTVFSIDTCIRKFEEVWK